MILRTLRDRASKHLGVPVKKAVITVPAYFNDAQRTATRDAGRLAALLPRQLLRSWYIMYFQLPWLPERSASWVVPRLWRQWSPGYGADVARHPARSL